MMPPLPKGMGPGGGAVGMGLKLPAATSPQAYLGVCVCVLSGLELLTVSFTLGHKYNQHLKVVTA